VDLDDRTPADALSSPPVKGTVVGGKEITLLSQFRSAVLAFCNGGFLIEPSPSRQCKEDISDSGERLIEQKPSSCAE